MHKKILKDMNDVDAKEYLIDLVSMLKSTDEKLYEEIEQDLYKKVYGCHFNKWLLDCATSKLQNEDGTSGAHWTVEQTNSVAKSNSISFERFNEYDWNYAMNMVYSDFYGAIPNETSYYVRLAKKFIDDKDAQTGKALIYYWAMK